MNAPSNRESHLRSIAKGISWRFVAFFDTVIVSFIVSWAIVGKPLIAVGFTIAGFEFFIKIAIYYFHERAWQFAYNDGVVTKLETLFKTISWRVIATTSTFIIALLVLSNQENPSESNKSLATVIALTESISKFILFYFHERAWLNLPLGSIRELFQKKN